MVSNYLGRFEHLQATLGASIPDSPPYKYVYYGITSEYELMHPTESGSFHDEYYDQNNSNSREDCNEQNSIFSYSERKTG
jgi:hypothetical protein